MTQNTEFSHSEQRLVRIKMAQAVLNMHALREEMELYDLSSLQKSASVGRGQEQRIKYAALRFQYELEKQAFIGAVLRAAAKSGMKGLLGAGKGSGKGISKGIGKAFGFGGRASTKTKTLPGRFGRAPARTSAPTSTPASQAGKPEVLDFGLDDGFAYVGQPVGGTSDAARAAYAAARQGPLPTLSRGPAVPTQIISRGSGPIGSPTSPTLYGPSTPGRITRTGSYPVDMADDFIEIREPVGPLMEWVKGMPKGTFRDAAAYAAGRGSRAAVPTGKSLAKRVATGAGLVGGAGALASISGHQQLPTPGSTTGRPVVGGAGRPVVGGAGGPVVGGAGGPVRGPVVDPSIAAEMGGAGGPVRGPAVDASIVSELGREAAQEQGRRRRRKRRRRGGGDGDLENTIAPAMQEQSPPDISAMQQMMNAAAGGGGNDGNGSFYPWSDQ